jgi:cell fate regulator YaaT (PSP1 superfamily)
MTTTQDQTTADAVTVDAGLIETPEIEKEIKQDSSQVYGLKFENRVGVFTIRSDTKYDLGARVIVKTDRGKELCSIKYVELNKELDRKKELDIISIIRPINENDEVIIKRNAEKQKSARDIAKRKVEELNLQMKISSVEYLFDSSRIIFYFLAPRKVDFRELVRLLASEFKTRIELRQITSRQNVSMKGAVGSCGLETCCSSFSTRTPVVSMDMVETQRLSKNPAKLNGVCGKLKCCLSYENNFYEEATEGIPTRGSCVKCKSGKKGKVCGINVFTEEMTIYVDEESTYENINFSDILSEEEIRKQEQEQAEKDVNRAKKQSKDNKSPSQNNVKSNNKDSKADSKPSNTDEKITVDNELTNSENKSKEFDNKKNKTNTQSNSPKNNVNSQQGSNSDKQVHKIEQEKTEPKQEKPGEVSAQDKGEAKAELNNKNRRNRKKNPKKASPTSESSPTNK